MGQGNDDKDVFGDSILSTLRGSKSSSMEVKSLRKLVLLTLQVDESKDEKKKFKKTILDLESNDQINLNEDGVVSLSKAEIKAHKKRKKENKDSSKKKRKVAEQEDDDEAPTKQETVQELSVDCKANPQKITRLFIGNLPFTVEEASLHSFLSPAVVTHIKWITDKETGRFYGSAFIEMAKAKDAAVAISRNGSELTDRKIKINYAPARPDDIWPPKGKSITGQTAGGSGLKALGPHPDGCMKLFVGNLSYEIDDEGICKFFAAVDAEVKAVRWIHHKDSGDFKGVGFIEFWNVEACKKAATLNAKNLMGRPIRIDWTD